MRYSIELTSETEQFYVQIAQHAGLPVEQVLSDALFRYAGELSVQALRQSRPSPYPS